MIITIRLIILKYNFITRQQMSFELSPTHSRQVSPSCRSEGRDHWGVSSRAGQPTPPSDRGPVLTLSPPSSFWLLTPASPHVLQTVGHLAMEVTLNTHSVSQCPKLYSTTYDSSRINVTLTPKSSFIQVSSDNVPNGRSRNLGYWQLNLVVSRQCPVNVVN